MRDFENWELDKLSDYIVDKHHTYTRNAIINIRQQSKEAVEKSGVAFPELKEISSTFEETAKAIEDHLAGEEKYLFPYIKKMLAAKKEAEILPIPGFGSLDKPLKQHVEEHDHVKELMQKIKAFSKDYVVPEGAMNAHKTLYQALEALEKDLQQHIYLEDDILFGRSIELEKEVVGFGE